MNKSTRRSLAATVIMLAGLAAFSASPAAAAVVFEESCFPTCDITDGRFLIIAGGVSLETLTDEALRLKFAVDSTRLGPDNRFTFEIFDGDSNGCATANPCIPSTGGDAHWDIGLPVEVTYRLIAIETLADGTTIETDVSPAKIQVAAGPQTNPLSSTQMMDNGWFAVTVEVGPEARVANTGDYLYTLELLRDPLFVFPTGAGLLNALKVRTDQSVFLSLLEQPFAFEAKWASGLFDLPIIYPNFNIAVPFSPAGVGSTTYDGSFTFLISVRPPMPGDTRTELRIFDGDLDRGKFNGQDSDTDDADISYPVPCLFGDPSCPLPFQIGPGARTEGVAFSTRFPGSTGSPPDDSSLAGLGIFNLRTPSVEYRVDFPPNTDPGTILCRAGESVEDSVEGRRSIRNLNPSGNKEWETFVLSTDPFDPDIMDCHVDALPSGVYRVEVLGMDMNNLNAWFFGEDVCGVRPNSDPFCPSGVFLIGDTVWQDTDGDGNGDPAEIAADGESGFQGVVVRALNADGNEIGRALTDANGQYRFAVAPGEYTVEVLPENFTASPARGALGDRVWLDANRDGVEDPGEIGIPGVTVELYDAGGDGLPGGGDDILLDTTVTGVFGFYSFTGLAAGTYYTAVLDSTVPAGLSLTGGTDPSAVRTIVSDDVFLDLDFGYGSTDPSLAIVGDFVWHDLDADGVQDPGEPGITGVYVRLLDSSGVAVATAVTYGGSYLFTGLAAGDYQVDVIDTLGVLAGYSLTTGNDPTGLFTVNGGDVLLDKDFGYVNGNLFSIADRVWYDADRDGLLDAGEPALGGVTVTLIGPRGGALATTTSAADGTFSFAGLPNGSYSIVITDIGRVLNGLLPTTNGALNGSTGVTIAGADVSGINFGYVSSGVLAGTLPTTPSPTQNDLVVDTNVLTYDFGYRSQCGACDGKVNRLILRYLGSQPATVRVEQRKGEVVFPDTLLAPGAQFEIFGVDKQNTLGPEISVFVNGALHTRIHTSCSQPIGPGLIFGDFLVVEGESRHGGLLCPLDTPPPTQPESCGCDGKVTRLELRYLGFQPAQVEVKQKKDDSIVFFDIVQPGEVFSFSGQDKKGTLGPEIRISVNGVLHTEIHTSCSQPIGPGLVRGNFEVVDGDSRNIAPLCPL